MSRKKNRANVGTLRRLMEGYQNLLTGENRGSHSYQNYRRF